MVLLEARELYRFYHTAEEEVLALKGVSLSLRAGEFVAVVGPSGSGKSTLLACLAGLDEPDGGTIVIMGERMTRKSEITRARLRAHHLGILLQSGNVFDHLTVKANVLLQLQISGSLEKHGRIHEVLEKLGIAHKADTYPHRLSGGELARAGLAMALAARPAILLADEPTAEVDAQTEKAVIAEFVQRSGRGESTLVVTHSHLLAHRASRVLRLQDGQIDNA